MLACTVLDVLATPHKHFRCLWPQRETLASICCLNVQGAAQLYVESILALQARAAPDTQLPLAIMTSGDTHERTEALLRDNRNFGMTDGQITLLKQEKVSWLQLPDIALSGTCYLYSGLSWFGYAM